MRTEKRTWLFFFFFFLLIICNALLDKNGTPLPVLLIQTNEQEEKNSATAMVLSSWVRMHQGKGWLGALIASKQTFENNTAPILHFSPKQSCSFSMEGGCLLNQPSPLGFSRTAGDVAGKKKKESG